MSMDLIGIYIHEVTRRLPEKNRADIELELHSIIKDMLPDDYTEEDVKEALQQLGNPAVLASRYQDRPMHLIGPRYYDLYITLLKMILPITASVVLFVVLIAEIVQYEAGIAVMNSVFGVIGEAIWKAFATTTQTFFWLTLVFALLDRKSGSDAGEPLTMMHKEWTPEDLKHVVYTPPVERAVSKKHVFFSLLWTAVWGTVYFNADRLVGVYEGFRSKSTFVMPALNQELLNSYMLLAIIAIVLEVGFALYLLVKREWTRQAAWLNMAVQCTVTLLFIFLLTRPQFFLPEFAAYAGDLIGLAPEVFEDRAVLFISALFVLGAVYNCWEVFRKSRHSRKSQL